MEHIELNDVTNYDAICQILTEIVFEGRVPLLPRTDEEMAELFDCMPEGYMTASLRLTYPCMTRETLARVLPIVWRRDFTPHYDHNVSPALYTRLFKLCVPERLMSADELRVYRELPDKLTVYRGVSTRVRQRSKGIAWTLSEDSARDYAQYHAGWTFGKPSVYRATIRKKYVFMYTDWDGKPAVYLDYHYLKDMEEIPVTADREAPTAQQFPSTDDGITLPGTLERHEITIRDLVEMHQSIQHCYQLMQTLDDPEDAEHLDRVLGMATDVLLNTCYGMGFNPNALDYWEPGNDIIVTPFDPRIPECDEP